MKKSLVLPTNENIFVRRIDPTTITEGGIVVPDQSIDRPAEGTIVAIGPSVYTSDRRVHELAAYQLYLDKNNRFDDESVEDHHMFYAQTFNLGDHVIFGRFAGIDVTIDDVTYVKLLPDEIFCVLREVETTETVNVNA